MTLKSSRPIGVFDSGLGGLTVVKEIMKRLPKEDVIYFGDTARVPYGTKSRESVIRFSKQNADILLKQKVKMLVVACNTSSSWALPVLRRRVNVPVIGVIDPGAKKAVEETRNKKVGVIATQSTVSSDKYAARIRMLDKKIRVTSCACPLFVPLAEEGWHDHPVTKTVAAQYLSVFKKSGIDTLILGCTHYPLLKKTIGKVMGRSVKLVDSAEEVARRVEIELSSRGLLKSTKRTKYVFLVSDQPKHFEKQAKQFLGTKITNVKRVKF